MLQVSIGRTLALQENGSLILFFLPSRFYKVNRKKILHLPNWLNLSDDELKLRASITGKKNLKNPGIALHYLT